MPGATAHLFQTPYHCQTMTEDNKGHQSLLRWHITDNVPFQTSFEGCIEKYFPNDKGTLYACTACFYLAPGGVDPLGDTPVQQRDDYYEHPSLGGGGYKVSGKPNGNVDSQSMGHIAGSKWHDDNQLWWTGAKPGDKLDLVLPVPKVGDYAVSVTLTKARDYGIVQFHLDGKKISEPIDLYNPDVILAEPLLLGTQQLAEGTHTLTVEIVGANDAAVKKYMFGLDQILLKPVK